MIDIIDNMRLGDAVYWEPQTDEHGRILTDRYNRPLWKEPVELIGNSTEGGVFWIDRTEVIVDRKGQSKNTRAIVFVGIDAKEFGVLFKGRMADVPPGMGSDPLLIPGAAQIIRFDKIPTLEYTQFVRKCYL